MNQVSKQTLKTLTNDQVSIEEINARPINLIHVLVAHQLVLSALYFFLPFWIFIFNTLVLGLVYFSKTRNKFKLVRGAKVLLTFIAVAGVLISFHRLTGRDAGVSLIAIMYGLKIIEIESKRDVYILMLLGFFLLLAAFLFSRSPFIALYQFVPVMAILYALQSIHTTQLPKAFKYADLKSNQGYFNSALFSSSSKYLFKQLIKYLMLALPLMILLFLFFPRLSGPIWKMQGDKKATTGISDSMTPGEISSLHLSDKIAFRARFNGNEPSGNEFYWRTLVLDTFDGLTWTHANFEKSDDWINEEQVPFKKVKFLLKGMNKNEKQYHYEIALEGTQQKWLTYLDKPSRIQSNAIVFNDFSVSSNKKIYSRVKYKAESQTSLKLTLQLSDSSRRMNTHLPEGYNPRSVDWAEETRAKLASDELYIQSILQRINQSEYFYTLSPPIMDEDSVDSFWFDEQKGFCEHYAGALVFMARAANIPARVVIGYQGAEKNILSDYWIVRHLNAHAWTEIWFANKGWIRVDPTAAIAEHRIEEQLLTDYSQRSSLFESFNFDSIDLEEIGFSKQLEFWLDQVNSGWNDWFLEYNQILQQKLMANLGLDKLSREKIALLSLFLIFGFMLLINIKWKKNTVNQSILAKSIQLLMIKLVKQGINISSNRGFETFLVQLKSNDIALFSGSSKVILSQNSIQNLEILLQYYQSIRYAQNNCTMKEQKAFYDRVKKLKLTRATA
ncbi:MAG: transglutaminase-like putative cysteine protease [Polaribacter sp.]|jgi:transglutaminase-like putative cysteine protease